VTREGHAPFWERPEVKFLRATRQPSYLLASAPVVLRGALRSGLRFHAAVVVACPSAVPSAWPVSVGSGAVREELWPEVGDGVTG